MRRKFVIAVFLVLALVLTGVVTQASAFGKDKKEKSHWSLENKFSKKVKTILSNKEELGLSDEQADIFGRNRWDRGGASRRGGRSRNQGAEGKEPPPRA